MERHEIPDAWRKQVVSTLAWRRASTQHDVGVGDLQGFAVIAKDFPGRGFLKPGTKITDAQAKCYAAREKIAADLAHDLRLSAPPAVLWRRKAPWEDVEPRVVVSLFTHSQILDWALVEYGGLRPPGLTKAEETRLLSDASGMLAFDTWLDQHEHAPHRPGNVVWGYNPADSQSAIVFLDYASALGSDGSWQSSGWSAVRAPALQPLLERHRDAPRIEEVVTSIEHFSDASIKEIVERIPTDFLPENEKAVLEEGLIGRKQLLRSALEAEKKP